MVSKSSITRVLKTIPDPELGISIWDLGLIYGIDIDTKNNVIIRMTLTTIGCPLFNLIADPIKEKIEALPGVLSVEVELTFEPPWNPDKMSTSARTELGM